MIRPATESDIPALAEMGRRFHALSPWRDVPFVSGKAQAFLAGLLNSPDACVLVADNDGPKGAIGLMLGPVYFADATMAQEAFWWCESPRDAVGLLRYGERWATARGACRLVMVRLEGVRDQAVDGLYRRMGFEPVEHHYAKGL